MKKVVKKAVAKVKRAVTSKKSKVKEAPLSSGIKGSCTDCGGGGLKDSNTLCPSCKGSGQV